MAPGSLIGQVPILRELLVLAQGHQLKLALGLWGWLGGPGWARSWAGAGGEGDAHPHPPPSRGRGEPLVRPEGGQARSAPTKW